AVPGRVRELRPELPGEGQHEERHTRAAAPDRWREGSHRPACDPPCGEQAVREVDGPDGAEGVPRPRTFPLYGSRLARGRRHGSRLARIQVLLTRVAVDPLISLA